MWNIRSRRSAAAAVLLFTTALLGSGCSSRTARLPVKVMDAVIPREGRTYALLLNGGGRPDINYRSHLQHVKGVLALLRTDGIRSQDIVVFSGDGADPAADLATREQTAGPEYWLFPQVSSRLMFPITFVDSTIDGVTLRPARKEALQAWFDKQGLWLRPGDTLLFYVTDHGRRNDADLTNNTIVLWGEELNVTELRQLLARLDPQVRVVMLMSQCYAGAFANEIYRGADDALPPGNICGYFASTADRPAYGCYPENRGKEGVGHSYEFLKALEPLGQLPEAERRVLVTDRTPDVPNTSSDFFLERLLRQKATTTNGNVSTLMDELLAEAWQNRGAWETDIRLLDRIGHTFGSFSPRSLAELEEQAKVLPEFSKQLDTYAARWREALEALKIENLERFVAEHSEWRDRLAPDQLKVSDPEVRRATAAALLGELVPFSKSNTERYARLLSLKQKADEASAASYRAEVRLGSVLRMRAILTSVAGRQYLAQHATDSERQAYQRLTACEDLKLSAHPAVAFAADLDAPEPFPPLAEEQRLVETVMPAWMGIRYSPLPEAERTKRGTQVGAVAVTSVFPDSPAVAAGLEAGDIILGPPGSHFVEPNQVREWTMRSEIGAPEALDVVREKRSIRITLHPGPYPVEMPHLPGPPKVGSAAPPLKVELVRGARQLAQGKPRLLYFWATWCHICKHALPEMLAFGQARNVEIVAISDEDADTQRKFLESFGEPFPSIVTSDPLRITLQSYGVSGTPTFVLVDGDGVVRYYQTGYTREKGLGIDGWHWEPEPTKAGGTVENQQSRVNSQQ